MRGSTPACLLALALLDACGVSGSACRSSEDCSGTLECASPNAPQVCGIPGNEQCSTDLDCDPSFRCHAVYDTCSADEVGSECRAPCTETSCGDGFRCGPNGACEVVPCDEGEPCPSYEVCDASVAQTGPVHARAPGCVAIVCSNDDACPSDGACVNGVCQEGPGTCEEPQLVP